MTGGTVGRDGQRIVVGVRALIVISLVAAHTVIRGIAIISSDMAKGTIIFNDLVRPGQWIEIVVVKCRWCPGIFAVAILTIGWELCSQMVRIRSTVIIILMAAETSVWGIVVIAIMTFNAVISYQGMCSI